MSVTAGSPAAQPLPPAAVPAPASDAVRQRGLLILLAIVVVAVFSGVFRAELLHWDDNINIYENPHLRGLGWKELWWMFTDYEYVRRYMPLGWLNYAVHYQIGGADPTSYHVGNLVLHVVNTFLVFALVRRLLAVRTAPDAAAPAAEATLAAPAIAALLWAVNPLRVETVAWASSQIYCQALLFFLLSVLAYLKARGPGEPVSRRCRLIVLAVAAYGASLLTYPIALGGLLVFVVLDVYPLRRLSADPRQWWRPEARKVWLEKCPFAAVVAGVLAITLLARAHSGVWQKPASVADFGLLERVMQAGYVWAYYLWKPWLPFELSPTYSTLFEVRPFAPVFVASWLLLAGLGAWLFWKRRQWPAALALFVCHLGVLVPFLGLTEHPHVAYDRYSYLVGIAWAVLLGVALARWWGHPARRAAMLAASVAVAVAMGALSFRQTRIWQNSRAIYEHVVRQLGDHPAGAEYDVVLGVLCVRQGDFARAETVFRQALQAKPRYATAHAHLANLLAEQRRFDEALEHYHEALRLAPQSRSTRQNLAITLGTMGRFEEAAREFTELLRLDPTNGLAHYNLAQTLGKLGREDAAREHLAEAQRLLARKPSR